MGTLATSRGSSGRLCWRFNVSVRNGGSVSLSGSNNGDSSVCRSVGRSGSISGSSNGSGDGSGISGLALQRE